MVASSYRDDIAARIGEEAQHRFRRLLGEAEAAGMRAEPDYVHPDRCIVWTPGEHGFCQLVSIEGCTCQRFRTWHRCPHHALVLHRLGIYVTTASAA